MDIKKQVIKVENVRVGHKCDNCGKTIYQSKFPDEWHHFMSYHNECGDDSCESVKSYDVCRPKCYIEKLTKIVETEMRDVNDGEVDNMEIQFARRMVFYFKNACKDK